ncbi:helix-turn-helix transcriptional regulator [Enterococcus faecalis]|uniref:helix-turn-helix domain-containing protein n=1 Tax=Enterococcus faecalis TaxID=1351 RepID=UPI00338E96A7
MIENFGGNVARLRKEFGYSQDDLGKEIGVNKQTISNIERGVRYPTFETLEKIAKVLNASATQLFGTEKEIEISETSYVIDRMDEYEDKMQGMMRFAKIFDEHYLREIEETYKKALYIQNLFTKQPSIDEEGHNILNEDNQNKLTLSFFDSLPIKEIDSLIEKIDYIKANQDLL